VYTNLIGEQRGGRDIETARQAAVRVTGPTTPL